MAFAKSKDVSGGRIKVTCPRCKRTSYLEVGNSSRRRIHRCQCGKSSSYDINYRAERREVTYGPARLVMRNGQEEKIQLHDTSADGVSFYISPSLAHSLSRGQEIGIKFRSGGGPALQRKAIIRNIFKNRIGAQYAKKGNSR